MKLLLLGLLVAMLVWGRQTRAQKDKSAGCIERAICSKYEHDEIRLRLMHGTNCTSFCHCATLASHDDATVTYYWERQNCSAGTQFDSSKGVCNHVGDFVCEDGWLTPPAQSTQPTPTTPIDCLVSQWTPWSGPLGFGQMTRERTILRLPANGGAACPAQLEEEKQSTQKPTIQSTATAMVSNLIRQPSVIKRGEAVGQLRDLLIIVDSSGSIGLASFETAKTQLARLLGMLCPISDPFDSRFQRAALLEYSSDVREIFDFDDKPNTKLVQQGVNSMPYMNAGTCTTTAFNYAYNNMFNTTKGMRNSTDVKQEVLILTDGQSNCVGNVTSAALKLQEKADVFGLMIGINTQSGMNELTNYVSYPKNKHLFAIEGFQALEALVNEIEKQVKNVPCVAFDV
ncbi:collagen alpha-1(XIV) chain-like isoform X1 [Dreissena polymorpha]|uniref:collagen alpha-1(XIV) chain-like isoform X1 n=1 Tax=Dreissena polymorpha TaxID=45954 RepID=UPI002265525E|nr:collagen alpha-1(XIV) chain-like isoform X1 [Dreissena polymorpha]